MITVSPQNRFPILGTIHLERIIILLSWLVLIFSNKIELRVSRITFLMLMLYLTMLISYSLSPYNNFFHAEHWLANYWKFIVLYFLILFSINDIKDIFYLFAGVVLILFLYQTHSWYDFLHGGAYVWQAEIKRMVGVWSTGVGAANYYGMITMLSLPFALFWFQVTERTSLKLFLIFYLIMSFSSIIYSGTRGAMLGFLFFLLLNIRTIKHFKVLTNLFVVLAAVSFMALPHYLKDRYLGLTPLMSNQQREMADFRHEQHRKSAEARWAGLTDGFKLAKLKPIFGHGPGSSALARKIVNEELRYYSEYDYAMHNLYGQLLAETGFLGTILFACIIITYFWKLREIRTIIGKCRNLRNYASALQNAMLLMLFYGIASHTLFRYHWFLLFACQVAFIDIVSRTLSQKAIGNHLNITARQTCEAP